MPAANAPGAVDARVPRRTVTTNQLAHTMEMQRMNPTPMRVVAALVAVFLSLNLLAELPERHPLDKSETSTFVLDNGLRVSIVSDPDLNLSAASMAVGVGSLSDPEDAPGLAHFLEHMLFLGTEKYPDADEYTQYLRQNGGYSNAYTSTDITNYHFQVYDEAFEGALDRFAQFFIAPLFTPELTEREMNAVNSEFQKNKEDDDWRRYQAFRDTLLPDHPECHFSSGNLETLANVSRETLIGFYEQHYSANQMALSIVSPLPLGAIEGWVREAFSAVPNRDLPKLRYPERYLPLDGRMNLVRMKSLQDRRDMTLMFNLGSLVNDWDAKTTEVINYIVGHEGEGSLLSVLKAENLATGMGAATWQQTVDYATLFFDVSLTDKGLAQYERVLDLVFQYIANMRASDYPEYIYEELATMAALDRVYSDRGEGTGRAVSMANRALHLPLEHSIDAPFLYLRKDPDFYAQVLDQLRPDNALVMLVAPHLETDTIDPIFGTELARDAIPQDLFDRLSNPRIEPHITLPAPNPFIPRDVVLLDERPVRLIDEPGLILYYGQDTEFKRPKVSMTFRVHAPDRAIDARTSTLFDLYQAAVLEAVNETGYAARAAGLTYDVSAGPKGIAISVFGYNDSAHALLGELVAAVRGFSLEEERFEALKERMIRDWQNQSRENAFLYIRFFQNQLAEKNAYGPEQKALEAQSIRLADVYAFRDTASTRGRVEALVYGNTSREDAIAAARTVADAFALEPIDADELYQTELLRLAPGEHAVAKFTLPSNNSVYRQDFVMGTETPQLRVAAAVLENLLGAPYYSELRTRQQLGYVVGSFMFPRDKEYRLGVLIQSGDYDPLELEARSNAFLAGFVEALAATPEQAFEQAKEAVRSEITERPTNIAEKARKFFDLAYNRDGDWDRDAHALAALDALSLADVQALLRATIAPETARSEKTYLFARQHAELAESVDAVEDIAAWKQDQKYAPVRS